MSTNIFGFGHVFAETDVPNKIDGGNCFAWAKLAPRWYWKIRRLHLFFGIVWRKYETSRIDIKTAWDVSKCAEGLSR